jgi:hypothetical protein
MAITYQVKFYKGDYRERQRAANADDCIAYIEQHFNSASSSSNYAVVITGYGASQASKNWGRWYAKSVGREFGIPVAGDGGILVGGYNGRGDANLRYTKMPAVLLEPLFASNPRHAEWIISETGQYRLALILVESIRRFFPDGGKIAFSVGHKYKISSPDDKGANVVGGGMEADYAEEVLLRAKTMLETGIEEEPAGRKIRVMRDGEELWHYYADEDEYIDWDPVRGILRVLS